jgi:hypothetical protein
MKLRPCLDLDQAMIGVMVKNKNKALDKHDRRVLLRVTRRFRSGYLLIEYLIGRKWYDINLDQKI